MRKDWKQVKFYRCFLVVFGTIFAAGAARAQCCWCDAADGCSVGKVRSYTPVGTPICESCDGLPGYTGCLHCNCYGYDHPCPSGVHTGAKCLKMDCPGSCTGYKVCYPWLNTDPEELIIGDCHLENNTCYSNTRACSDFEISADYGQWSCSKNSQTGNAKWNQSENAWDTVGCGCNVVDKDIAMDVANTAIKCKKANAVYHVTNANRYSTKKVSDYIHYSTQRRWCAQCYPGYLPVTDGSPDSYGIYLRPNNNDNWGVASCATQVTVPDYAPGCTINFNLATVDEVMAACRGICPTGFETEENGATSISDCRPTPYAPTYEDNTGTFVLPSLVSCQ